MLLALWLSACGAPRQPVRPAPVQGLIRDTPPVLVENADGSCSRTLLPEDVPTAPWVRGAITWIYAGQARLSCGGAPSLSSRSVTRRACRGGRNLTPYEELIGSRSIDDRGREWHVLAVDEALACEKLRRHCPDCECDLHRRPPWSFPTCGKVTFL